MSMPQPTTNTSCFCAGGHRLQGRGAGGYWGAAGALTHLSCFCLGSPSSLLPLMQWGWELRVVGVGGSLDAWVPRLPLPLQGMRRLQSLPCFSFSTWQCPAPGTLSWGARLCQYIQPLFFSPPPHTGGSTG